MSKIKEHHNQTNQRKDACEQRGPLHVQNNSVVDKGAPIPGRFQTFHATTATQPRTATRRYVRIN